MLYYKIESEGDKMTEELIIIGGGAAGMMAAITAAGCGVRPILLEGGERVGRKILSTGNGKCNYTNYHMTPDCFRSTDSAFPAEVLRHFNEKNTIRFFRSLGILPYDRNGYVYPRSEQAASVLDALRRGLEERDVREHTSCKVQRVSRTGDGFLVETEVGNFHAKRLILATGGCAAPKTGSDGSGFILARQLGHTIVSPVPALVQLRAEEPFFKSISGVRTQARVTILIDGKPAASDRGEVQLTDYGISGIPVFQVSRYISRELEMSKRPYIEVDFLPEFSAEELYEELLRRKRCHPKLETSYILEGIMNNKLTDAVLLKCGIGSRTLLNELTGRQCQNICAAVKCFRADVSETAGFDNAQVTSGGVSRSEIDFEDMSSKVCEGLYLAGEIVDVDGICGGYNLQWAWSSGYIAGKGAAGGKQK